MELEDYHFLNGKMIRL